MATNAPATKTAAVKAPRVINPNALALLVKGRVQRAVTEGDPTKQMTVEQMEYLENTLKASLRLVQFYRAEQA